MTDLSITELLEFDQPHVELPRWFPDYARSVELAALLGISDSRINQLGKDGHLPRTTVGGIHRYPFPAAAHAYVAYCKSNPVGRRIANPDLADQKHRLAKEQADKIALANAITRAELVPVSDVSREWRSVAMDLRARLLAIGPRVASTLGLDRATTANLDTELRAALEDVADDR